MYYDAPDSAPKDAFIYQGDEAAGRVPLPRRNFSKPFELAEGALRVSLLPAALAEGVSIPEQAPAIQIPKEWDKVLILAFPDPNNPIFPIRLKALDASDDVFGPGELLFINFAEVSIFGMVGEQKLLLHPETIQVISHPIPDKGEYQIKLDSVKNDIESRRWLMRQTWRHQPKVEDRGEASSMRIRYAPSRRSH
ncbi:hypothetical protein QEH59_17215 [Coraliomargarita sp. SDUM461004]|uniref:Uncharacterized protein n=1 Tax=Thalassobacterium sedimentorum TaxID=3041258 RepID=A0ABU1AN02_9BACT|nr:hypothetical protein [Coraliomargarita sp. SDUM461004]MDQ8196179.1 hypothetical protein [Coraliomargarita sp. SDUM461004]